MLLALTTLLAGLLVIGAIVGMRSLDAWHWARSLTALRLSLPTDLSPEQIASFLTVVAAMTHPSKRTLLPYPPVAVEVVATHQRITHYVLVPRAMEARFMSVLRATLPGARVEQVPAFVEARPKLSIAAEAKLTSTQRLLADTRSATLNAALLASLQPLGPGEEIRYQVIMTSAGTPKPVHSASAKPDDAWWSSYLVEGVRPSDADAIRAQRLKHDAPLLQAVIRLGVQADSKARARSLFGRSWGALHTMNAPGVRLVRRWLPSLTVVARLQARMHPQRCWHWLGRR